MFSRKSRALRRPWVWGCEPSSRGHRYWGVPGQGAYVGRDDPAHPWNGHHHEGGVSGYRLRIQGALPTLASRVGSQDLPERAGVASHAHCIGRYARTAAIRRLQNYGITRLRSCLIAGLADCVIAHSGNPKIYNSCNPPIRPPSLRLTPHPASTTSNRTPATRNDTTASGDAGPHGNRRSWGVPPIPPPGLAVCAKAAGSTTRSWAGTATRTRPGKSASLRTN